MALGVRANRSRCLLGLLLLALLCLPACKKAVKTGPTDGTSNSSGGNSPGNANGAGGGFIPQARPALPEGWREFKHPDGVYSIFVPAQPRHDPMSSPSLKLNQPLGPAEARESHYGILPSAKQPYLIEMRVMLFDPALQSTLEQSYAMNRPKDDINHKWKEFREVTWAGRRATESVLEKTFLQSGNAPPKHFHQVARYLFTPGRLYTFLIERENEPPTPTDLAAFFDSFVVGE